jgi:hypothetical protein
MMFYNFQKKKGSSINADEAHTKIFCCGIWIIDPIFSGAGCDRGLRRWIQIRDPVWNHKWFCGSEIAFTRLAKKELNGFS